MGASQNQNERPTERETTLPYLTPRDHEAAKGSDFDGWISVALGVLALSTWIVFPYVPFEPNAPHCASVFVAPVGAILAIWSIIKSRGRPLAPWIGLASNAAAIGCLVLALR